jgi:oligopeptide/dipeptide ABC transporter ATP-binding protein
VIAPRANADAGHVSRESEKSLVMGDVSVHFPVNAGFLQRKRFIRAVQNVSLTLKRGEMLGVVGESGCGKSTLARALLQLQPMSGGTIELDGRPAQDIPPLEFRQRIQMVFQDPYNSLNPRRTAGSIIMESLVVHGRGSPVERRRLAIEMMEKVGLNASHFDRYPHEFSGGQRQRIAIARALIIQPDFLILDEPTSALDVSVQARVIALIQGFKESLDLGCMFISHDLNLVGYLVDRVAVMYLGRVVELAPVERVFSKPLHPYTEALMAATPHPFAEHGTVRRPLQGEIPSNVNIPQGCPFHTRCPRRIGPVCDTVAPQPVVIDDREVRCHLYGGDAAETELLEAAS